jgi:hypothetical protein
MIEGVGVVVILTAQSDCSNQGMRRRSPKERRGEDFLEEGQFCSASVWDCLARLLKA